MIPSWPRLVIAGTGGDAGKTLVSLALLSAWRGAGHRVAAFKKGPDYIDRAWLAWAAGMPARNLDAWLMPREALRASFVAGAEGARVSVVEGNRGLYDGLDEHGATSTAELAKALAAPVVLLLDAAKVTRTVAAVALGMQRFDPDCPLAGVILNRVRGSRHERVIRRSVTAATGLPVLGAIPRQSDLGQLLPDRHLGLVTPEEHARQADLAERLEGLARSALDLDGLLSVADQAPAWSGPAPVTLSRTEPQVRIGYFTDRAFTFYYPENLDALRAAGAELVPISATTDAALPAVDGLYIGGGFPETQAEALSGNEALRDAVREASRSGLPIYAECGGLMYLSRSVRWQGVTYPMAGVFALDLDVGSRPRGHGYMEVEVDGENPVFPVGTRLRGHEFHYSSIRAGGAIPPTAYAVKRGTGTGAGRDGLVAGNTLASYLHLHAVGVPQWASGLVAAASRKRSADGRNPD